MSFRPGNTQQKTYRTFLELSRFLQSLSDLEAGRGLNQNEIEEDVRPNPSLELHGNPWLLLHQMFAVFDDPATVTVRPEG